MKVVLKASRSNEATVEYRSLDHYFRVCCVSGDHSCKDSICNVHIEKQEPISEEQYVKNHPTFFLGICHIIADEASVTERKEPHKQELNLLPTRLRP